MKCDLRVYPLLIRGIVDGSRLRITTLPLSLWQAGPLLLLHLPHIVPILTVEILNEFMHNLAIALHCSSCRVKSRDVHIRITDQIKDFNKCI